VGGKRLIGRESRCGPIGTALSARDCSVIIRLVGRALLMVDRSLRRAMLFDVRLHRLIFSIEQKTARSTNCLRRFATGNTNSCCNESQSAIPDSDFDLVRGPGRRGDAFVDLARGLRDRAHHDGRRASRAERMAAHRCAACRGHRFVNGNDRLRICRAKTVVASYRDRDVQLDYCLLVDPWRAEPDSPCDYVARDYQCFRVWWRVRLVFLF